MFDDRTEVWGCEPLPKPIRVENPDGTYARNIGAMMDVNTRAIEQLIEIVEDQQLQIVELSSKVNSVSQVAVTSLINISVNETLNITAENITVNITLPAENITVKESDLKKGSIEYKLSLIIDTMLNIKRRKMSK